jgi:hypothetical protein
VKPEEYTDWQNADQRMRDVVVDEPPELVLSPWDIELALFVALLRSVLWLLKAELLLERMRLNGAQLVFDRNLRRECATL